MKKLLLVFFLLFNIPNLAYAAQAQPGYYTRINCGTLATPTTNGTVCLQTTTAGGRTGGRLYVWNGTAWADLNTVTGVGTGSAVILDLGNDGSNESTSLGKLATSGDTNSVFTRPVADSLLIDLSKKWPVSGTADALTAAPTLCSAGAAGRGVLASGNATGCTDFMEEPAGNGITVRSAANTSINRSITGQAGKVSVANGDGVSGNPLIDLDASVALTSQANSYTAGMKQTFGHSATTAGVNINPATGDPSSPANGDIWYNSSTGKFRKREGGSTTDLDTTGGSVGFGAITTGTNTNPLLIGAGGSLGTTGGGTIAATTAATATLATTATALNATPVLCSAGSAPRGVLAVGDASGCSDFMEEPASSGFVARTGANASSGRTLQAPAAGLTISNPAGAAGDPAFALANDLAALEALSSTGIAVRTTTDTWAQRTLQAPAAGFTITNPAGVGGDPTFTLSNDLAALEGLGSTGFAVRSATDTWVQRSFVDQTSVLTWTNPAGIVGNPTPVIATPLIDGSMTYAADAGSTDSYAWCPTPASAGYVVGARDRFKANTANTGAATGNKCALGAKTIKKAVGGITTDLADNDIRAGQIVDVVYDGTNYQMQSTLGNAGAGSGTVSGTVGTIAKFTSTTVAGDSGLVEDADSFNFTKKLEVGDVTTNGVALDTSAITGSKSYTAPNVTGLLQVDGAIAINVETAGNTITTVSKLWMPAAGGTAAAPTLLWDTLASNAPTASCSAGATETTLLRCLADFPDSDGDFSLQQTILLPSDWTGVIDLKFLWRAAATGSIDVVWQATLVCRADGEVDDAVFNTSNTVTDTTKGTANQLNTATINSMTTTGCSAGELAHLKVFRNRTHTSDTITGIISLVGVEATMRRAQ